MMTLEEASAALSDRNVMEVARRTGINHQTLWRIKNGSAQEPSFHVMKKLIEYLEGASNAA